MKILKVTLRNLNSLKGDHGVDFAAEPLASAGIFAITGPTGAGKTTILDAITLGLFGKAARYGNEPSPEEVMTRGTAECHAEVTFGVREGIFTAHWSLARARNRVDGKIQQPRRSLRDASNRILAERISDVNDHIERLLGLDHDRFMRSAMLAQGQFARFLTSKPDDRAQLLESITGSDICSRISILAFEEAGWLEQGVDQLEEQIRQIEVLPAERIQEIQADIQKMESEKSTVDGAIQTAAALNARINQLQEKEGEVTKQDAALKSAEAERAEDLEEFEALERHLATVPFAEALTRLDKAMEDVVETRNELVSLDEDLESAVAALSQAAADQQAAVRHSLDDAGKRVQRGRALRKSSASRMAAARKFLDARKKEADLVRNVGVISAVIGAECEARTTLGKACTDWTRRATPLLAGGDVGIPATLATLSPSRLKQHLQGVLKLAKANQTTWQARHAKAQKTLEDAQKAREAALLVQKYAEDRTQLVEGEPCPLCGSTRHPHAPRRSVAAEISHIEKDIRVARQGVTDSQKSLTGATQTLSQLENAARHLSESHAEVIAKAEVRVARIEALGLDPSLDVEALQKRADDYSAMQAESREAKSDHDRARQEIADGTKRLAEALQKQKKGIRLPKEVRVADEAMEVDLEEAETALADAFSGFKETKALQSAATGRLKSREGTAGTLRTELVAKAARSRFKTIEALCEARMDPDDVDRIANTRKAIEDRIRDAGTLLKKARKEVSKLIEDGVPRGEAAEASKASHEGLMARHTELVAAITSHRNSLGQDAANRKKREELEAGLSGRRKQVEVLRRLRELIGSKDGAKFRKFAQSITLEVLTHHANRHLVRLTDRYTLHRQGGDALELEIEDHYQARTRRPLASLSGGESFLASLALALGLSDLAGRSVRIQTLFIDEGFGTLDPETLEIALDALEVLRQGNKSVGIISHVGLLKERIHTQVVVTRKASGHSTLGVVPRSPSATA